MSKTLKKNYARPECLVVNTVIEPILESVSSTTGKINQPGEGGIFSKDADWDDEESQSDWGYQSYDE